MKTMKLKPLLIAALCAMNLGASHAAPTKATAVKKAPAKDTPVTSSAKPVIGTVVIDAVTRNDVASKITLLLAQDGKAKLPIVISTKASDATKAVAKDLAEYLGKISGAIFKIETGDGSKGIVLGSMKDFPTPALSKALEIFNGYDGKEAYAIRTRPDNVLLLGATDLGASHAAYRFLKELGCRWFFPYKAWEVVPSTPDLKFARNITDRPQILSRVVWFEAGSGGGNPEKDYENWRRRNAQAESFKGASGGKMNDVFSKEVLDAHPEYSALWTQADGTLKRDPGSYQMELANPAVRKIIVDAAVNTFKQNPNADTVSIDPADTNAHSLSPESLAMGSVSDRVFGMANEVARAIEKAFPGQHKMVSLLSYNSTYDPPSFKLEPNVHVYLATIGANMKYTPEERYKLWPTRSSNLGVYEYYSVWAWSHDSLPGSYTNNVRDLQRNIRDLVGGGYISISAESTSSWGSNGRGYYVANKLMWNPNLDLDALLDDFYTKAFGPAAKYIKSYYDRLDPSTNPLWSPQLFAQVFRDVDNATKAAKAAGVPSGPMMARLDHIKMYLRFVDLTWRRNRQGVAVDNELIMSNLFRTRDYDLTAWNMIKQSWAGGTANDAPYTREEVEKEFQEGLAYYPYRTDLGEEVKYSDDLVPVAWTEGQKGVTAIPAQMTQGYWGKITYAMYSLRGEPLQFTTKAVWFRGDHAYSVKDAKGALISSGKIKDVELKTYQIKVPDPGLYWLEYLGGGDKWEISLQPGDAASIVLGVPYNSSYANTIVAPQMFFYVPKGTKTIVYFYTTTAYHPGGPHNVLDPMGKVVKEVNTTGDWITVPVPEGMDGKVWSFQNPSMGTFKFNNLPNLYAAAPDALLVPRELAVKDGLAIRK